MTGMMYYLIEIPLLYGHHFTATSSQTSQQRNIASGCQGPWQLYRVHQKEERYMTYLGSETLGSNPRSVQSHLATVA